MNMERNDTFPIGTAAGGDEDDEKVLYLKKHHITGTDNTIELVLEAEPYEAGIDPYNKLVDRSSGDNRKRVTVQ